MVVKEVYGAILSKLRENVPDPHGEAALIMKTLFDMEKVDIFLKAETEISEDNNYNGILERRLAGEPLAYVLGQTYFYGRLFACRPPVLIPRLDSEFLIESILRENALNRRVLELGVGSGALAISLALERPTWQITGVDLSQHALSLAKENGQRYCVDIKWEEGNGFQYVQGQYDIIYSNPPYIPTEELTMLPSSVIHYEPHLALDGGEDGLRFYRRWTAEAFERLNIGGILAYEVGHNQGHHVRRILGHNGFRELEIIRDLAGLDRVVIGRKR